MRLLTSAVVILLLAAPLLAADRIPPTVDTRTEAAAARVGRWIDRNGMPLLARLKAVVNEVQLEPFLQHDGSMSEIPEPLQVSVSQRSSEFLEPAAIGRITVDGAATVRLRIDGAPPGTKLWVAGSDDENFAPFVPSDIARWTPTTTGSTVFLAAESGVGQLTISAFVTRTEATAVTNSCAQDAACVDEAVFPGLIDAARAIAMVRFVRNGQAYVCSGGLVSDTLQSQTPYFLTARHCISTPEEAASVEIIWDLRYSSCGSNQVGAVERTMGAELLVASSETDVALLKLPGTPAGRIFLGIEKRPLIPGTPTFRLSHANGTPQSYSAGIIEASETTCPTAPPSHYVYSKPTHGAIAPGSSGAPLLISGLYVAGQLLGACGPDPLNPCSVLNFTVDGSIAQSWPLLAPYLDPQVVSRRPAARR